MVWVWNSNEPTYSTGMKGDDQNCTAQGRKIHEFIILFYDGKEGGIISKFRAKIEVFDLFNELCEMKHLLKKHS